MSREKLIVFFLLVFGEKSKQENTCFGFGGKLKQGTKPCLVFGGKSKQDTKTCLVFGGKSKQDTKTCLFLVEN